MAIPDSSPDTSGILAAYLDHVRVTPLRELMPSLYYPSYMRNTPSLLLLRVPNEMQGGQKRGTGTLSDGYKSVLIETESDRRFVEGALSRPLVVRGNSILMKETIDKTNLRRSQISVSRHSGFLHYTPCERDWPHLLVVMSGSPIRGSGLIRERYAVFYYDTEAEVEAEMKVIAEASGAAGIPMQVRFGGKT